MHFYNNIYLILFFFFINGCANIVPPGGGPKDIEAPKLIKSNPINNSTNFTGKKIILEFNERVQVNNIEEQLLINPKPKSNFLTKVIKNFLVLEFKGNLDSNTTYNLTFQESVKDVTENIPTKNLQLAFSTGNKIDSLVIKGKLIDYEKNLPIENGVIGLYTFSDTLDITNSAPSYLAKTNKKGEFQLYNLKKEVYKIYGLQDLNKTLKKDVPEEKVAFINNFNLFKDTTLYLKAVKADIRPLKILQAKAISDKQFNLSFNKGLRSYYIKSLIGDSLYHNLSTNKKDVIIFNFGSISHKDSIKIVVQASDSLNKNIIDTINLAYLSKKDTKIETQQKKDPITGTIPIDKQLLPITKEISLVFSDPIIIDSLLKIKIRVDSNFLSTKKYNYQFNQNRTSLLINIQNTFNDSLVIDIPKGTFVNISSDTNTFKKFVFNKKKEESFSILEGSVLTKKRGFIVELVNDKYERVSYSGVSKFRFSFIPPGKYYLRAFIDTNNNREWDSGNILEEIPSEDIFYYKEPFELRANWEIIDITFHF